MATDDPARRADADDPDRGSIDLPIDLVQRLVANARRLRVLLIAITAVIGILALMGRLSVPEAAIAFTLLALTAFWTLPVAQARRGVEKVVAARTQGQGTASLERLVAQWPQPVIMLDQRAIVRAINSAARDLLDIRRPGDPLSYRMRDPDVLRAVQRALSDGVGDTCTILEKVPAERRITLHIQPFAEGSRARHVLIVVEDETAAYRAERMRSDFVANASHELRTPLAAITGCIETLQGSARNDPAAQARFLGIMAQQAGRMTALIDDLLSLNRVEMQAHRQPADCINLDAVTREALDLIRPAAEQAGVAVAYEAPMSASTVRGDAAELRQVALNLLQNAVKYGASGKRIEVALRDALEGGVRMVELAVRDFGPGIAQADLPRLTERFYRAHEESNPLATGTGLGLAIVKHIVARHRGRLIIDSDRGRGATFAVRIPFMTQTVELLPQDEELQSKSTG